MMKFSDHSPGSVNRFGHLKNFWKMADQALLKSWIHSCCFTLIKSLSSSFLLDFLKAPSFVSCGGLAKDWSAENRQSFLIRFLLIRKSLLCCHRSFIVESLARIPFGRYPGLSGRDLSLIYLSSGRLSPSKMAASSITPQYAISGETFCESPWSPFLFIQNASQRL